MTTAEIHHHIHGPPTPRDYVRESAWVKYDYTNQAWTAFGRYLSCGHPLTLNCKCFGRIHEGEGLRPNVDLH